MGGSVQGAPRTSLRRVISDDDEGRNARVCRDTGAGRETASQINECAHFNAVGVTTRATVRRGFGELVSGAGFFNQTLGVLSFESFENLVECLCLCFRSFHTLYSPSLLSMAEGGPKRKRMFKKNILLGLILSFRAGEEVRASRALMV